VTDWVAVAGRWSIRRDITVTLQCILANAGGVRALVIALLPDKAFFRCLPDDEDEIARYFGSDGHMVQPWGAKTPSTEHRAPGTGSSVVLSSRSSFKNIIE
jgi:hypothetical protein